MKILPTIGSKTDRTFCGIGLLAMWFAPVIFGVMAYEAAPATAKICFSIVGASLLYLAYVLTIPGGGFRFVFQGK